MRILITSPIFPPDLGGPSVYVPAAATYLTERGHDVEVVAFCSDPRPTGYPFPVTAIPRGPLPLRYLKAFFTVLRRAGRADVVFVNEHLALLHVLAARLRRTPVVIRLMVDGAWEISHRKGWCRGDGIDAFQTGSYGWRVALTRRLQRLWWGGCARLIACSEYLRGIPIRTYGVPEAKVVRIFNAYNGPTARSVTETRDEARAELGLDPSRRYVLTICRLMVWKRVDGILRALAGLPEDVHLLVAGDGDMLEPWRAEAERLGLASRVQFLGNRPYSEIPLLIRAADVFCLNSEYEGLSHTLLEVLALGTPAVATDVCGNPELIEDGVTGLTVPAGDDDALRAALARMLDDAGLRARVTAEGRARMTQFLPEATFAQVEALLSEVARR